MIEYSRRVLALLVVLTFASLSTSHGAEVCGTWQVVSSPAPEDGSNLWGVDGIASDDVWAVGHFDDKYDPFSSDQFSLTLHWDGSGWSRIPSPSPGLYIGGGTDVFLYDVEMIASDDVWAGGTQKTQHSGDGFVGFQYFVLHWDGSSWTEVPAPETPVGGTGARFYGIDSLAPDDVWAVGSRVYPEVVGVDEAATALHWNGSEWREIVTPIVDEHQDLLRVRAFAPDEVWAVGGHGIEPTDQVYVIRWNGTSWQTVGGVPEPGLQNFLLDIDGVSSSDLWIVGEINDGLGGTRPLLFHYDGSSWTEFDVPGFPATQAAVEAVTVVASDDVWASGTYTGPDQVARPLILHWNGVVWTQVPEAPDGPTFGWFQAITSTGACDAWSVGQSGGVTHVQRLVPDTLEVADLTSFLTVRGIPVGGDLASLEASDDDRLRILSVASGARSVAGIELTASSPSGSISRLDVTVEWGLNGNGIAVGGSVRLFDLVAQRWVLLPPASIPSDDGVTAWASVADPSRYVDPVTGEIRLQVVSRTGPDVPPGTDFELAVDEVRVEVVTAQPG